METLYKTKGDVSILSRIGNTPLIPLNRIGKKEAPQAELYAKAEWFNPGGSVKDRPSLRMVEEAEKNGTLAPGKIILDATSGNTGIALAMIGAVKGYKVVLTLPKNANEERKKILTAYGAELVYTDPVQQSDGAILKARELYAAEPQKYFYVDQYNNENNWKAHYDTTGPEILEQTDGRVTHLICGLGTSGTLMGTGRRLKEANPAVRIIAAQPDSPFHGLEGLKHMESSIVPGIYDADFPDEQVFVRTEEAYAMTKRLAREEGLLTGISSGAALAAVLKIAAKAGRGVFVTVFPDGGDRYLSEKFWSS